MGKFVTGKCLAAVLCLAALATQVRADFYVGAIYVEDHGSGLPVAGFNVDLYCLTTDNLIGTYTTGSNGAVSFEFVGGYYYRITPSNLQPGQTTDPNYFRGEMPENNWWGMFVLYP